MSEDTSVGAHVTLLQEDDEMILGAKFEDIPFRTTSLSRGIQRIWVGYLAHKTKDLPFIVTGRRKVEYSDFEINGEQYSGIALYFNDEGDANLGDDDIYYSVYGEPRQVVNKDYVHKILGDLAWNVKCHYMKREHTE